MLEYLEILKFNVTVIYWYNENKNKNKSKKESKSKNTAELFVWVITLSLLRKKIWNFEGKCYAEDNVIRIIF